MVRTWSGSDYIVCCWLDDTSNTLLLNVYTWVGWWEKAFSEWMSFDHPIDLNRFQVVSSADTFLLVLSPTISKLNTLIYRFNRVKLKRATWVCSDSNNPDVHQGNQITVEKGTDFFVVLNNCLSLDFFVFFFKKAVLPSFQHLIQPDFYRNIVLHIYRSPTLPTWNEGW